MIEHKWSFEYRFIELENFRRRYGAIPEPWREELYFHLQQGSGEDIPDTGGLRRIRCSPDGPFGTSKKGWEVVFADYTYADIRKRFFWLLFKCPLTRDRVLGEGHNEELRRLKAKADFCMDLYYERLLREGRSNE